ncbi:MAG: helix-turn-helix domain-containing protein, partial [Desulfovibrionaceae bacterium]
ARELKGCMERAVSVCQEDTIRASHLPPSLQLKGDGDADMLCFTDAVERFEQELLVDALQRARGNMLEASRLLSTSYRIINYKVKKLGIDPKRFSVR